MVNPCLSLLSHSNALSLSSCLTMLQLISIVHKQLGAMQLQAVDDVEMPPPVIVNAPMCFLDCPTARHLWCCTAN